MHLYGLRKGIRLIREWNLKMPTDYFGTWLSKLDRYFDKILCETFDIVNINNEYQLSHDILDKTCNS